MKLESFIYESKIDAPINSVFEWHTRAGAFGRLKPPWQQLQILSHTGSIEDGARVELKSKAGPFWQKWSLEHKDYRENAQFVDVLQKGPFAAWTHKHLFSSEGTSTLMRDEIAYRLPLSALSQPLAGRWVNSELDQLFRYRHELLGKDFERYPVKRAPLKIMLTGASGLVGRNLCAFLRTQGHEVLEMSHRRREGACYWSPADQQIDREALEGVDAVIHLAGENIGSYWSSGKRQRIVNSRVDSTRFLAHELARMKQPPKVFVSASAIGYYGINAGEVDESSPRGNGFLADLSEAWEGAASEARDAGIRVVHPRIGVVLTPEGGALAKMLPAFRLGLGGRIGPGQQRVSWIAMDDLIDVLYTSVIDDTIEGPLNACAPDVVSNAELSERLGHVLKMPAILPAPAFILDKVFRGMAKETLLSDCCVRSHKLEAMHFDFRYPELGSALEHLLGKAETLNLRHSKKRCE